MPEINPLTNNQIFLKKIAENTGSDYDTGDVSEINPLTIDQIFLKEIVANTAGQSGDITELEEKISATQDMVSDAYDSTHTYNVGDYCIHENALYRCKTAIATPEAFTPAKWTPTTITDSLNQNTATQTVSVTYNDTIVEHNATFCGVHRSGNVVHVVYWGEAKTTGEVTSTVISGLPIPAVPRMVPFTLPLADSYGNTRNDIYVEVNLTGDLVFIGETTTPYNQGTIFICDFTYICNAR